MTRVVLVLATLAALCGAPSSLLAASPEPTPQSAPSDAPAVPGGDGGAGTASPAPSAEPRPAKSGKPTARPRTDEAPTAGGPASRDGRRGRPAAGGSRPGRGDRSHAAAASASPTAAADRAPSMVHDERMLPLAIVVSVSAVLLLATGWLLAAHGRDPAAPKVSARRMPLRAERASAHDPVLAALGLDEDDPAPPAGSD